MKSNLLEKSTNDHVVSRFFCSYSSMIRRIIRICKGVKWFLRFFLWFFLTYTIEKKDTINLSGYSSKSYASAVLSDSDITFLWQGHDAVFRSYLYWVLFIYNIAYSKDSLLFHNWGCISSKPAALPYLFIYLFIYFYLFRYCVKFFLRNLPKSDVSFTIKTFLVSLSLISSGFPSRFLKCSFLFWSISFWLAAISFALELPFPLLDSFTDYHANRWDCLSYIKILILLIWEIKKNNVISLSLSLSLTLCHSLSLSRYIYACVCVLVYVGVCGEKWDKEERKGRYWMWKRN